jgi:hypothetical protein
MLLALLLTGKAIITPHEFAAGASSWFGVGSDGPALRELGVKRMRRELSWDRIHLGPSHSPNLTTEGLGPWNLTMDSYVAQSPLERLAYKLYFLPQRRASHVHWYSCPSTQARTSQCLSPRYQVPLRSRTLLEIARYVV